MKVVCGCPALTPSPLFGIHLQHTQIQTNTHTQAHARACRPPIGSQHLVHTVDVIEERVSRGGGAVAARLGKRTRCECAGGSAAQVTRRRGVLLHVDSCLGGFVLPFARQLGYAVPAFDFSVPGVTSMSVDTHKFGMAHKGTSVVLYRSTRLREQQYTSVTEWTGGLYISPGACLTPAQGAGHHSVVPAATIRRRRPSSSRGLVQGLQLGALVLVVCWHTRSVSESGVRGLWLQALRAAAAALSLRLRGRAWFTSACRATSMSRRRSCR
jgi:Pyridoxal-dependent decarboxylase conserved domain